MDNSPVTEQDIEVRDNLVSALSLLRQAKPEERNEKARRYAVTITEMEKAIAYFNTFVCLELIGTNPND